MPGIAFDDEGRPAAPGVYGYEHKCGAPACLVVVVRGDSGEFGDEGELLAVEEDGLCLIESVEYCGHFFAPSAEELRELGEVGHPAAPGQPRDLPGQMTFWPDAEE